MTLALPWKTQKKNDNEASSSKYVNDFGSRSGGFSWTVFIKRANAIGSVISIKFAITNIM